MSFKLALCAAIAVGALLTGCATTNSDETDEISATPRADLTPLYDAPNRMRLACVSTVPLSVGNAFETLPLDCPALHITASVIELYDAGWRIESVNVGQDTRKNGAAEMPLTVTLRKLF